MAKAVVIAAPSSGSGKTLITLGLVRALNAAGIKTASAKVGPDYIDPRFHELASGRPCPNFDYWAMGKTNCASILASQAADADMIIVEGVMGLFDGPEGAEGSTADLAAALGLPVILVVDASHQSQSIAALVHGFRTFRSDVELAGVILNRVASPRHAALLKQALTPLGLPVIGSIGRVESLHWPSRHLGLVQAMENPSTEQFIAEAAAIMAREVELSSFAQIGREVNSGDAPIALAPMGQHMAIAHDEAFSFLYPHLTAGWRKAGAELSFFSPLADEPARANADCIYLPGGYPELHAEKLSHSKHFLPSLRTSDALIYGECGGYMVLGEALVDAEGTSHAMAGLLPHVTSFHQRKLNLGYRELTPVNGPWKHKLRAHEFHYSTLTKAGDGEALFTAANAARQDIGPMGQRHGKVMGSYAHIIASLGSA